MRGKTRAKNPELTEEIQEKISNNPKKPVKFDIELNEEQKIAKALIIENTITVLTGEQGSGKTQVAVITALDLLFKKIISKIYITKSLVVKKGSEIGFLPGDEAAKLHPFLIPIYDNLEKCYNRPEALHKLYETKTIEVTPLTYVRGRTFDDCVLIIDEAQNLDHEDMKMILPRVGKFGKIILCGDCAQIDFVNKELSNFEFVINISKKLPGMAHIELTANHRHELSRLILEEYKIKEKNDKKIK